MSAKVPELASRLLSAQDRARTVDLLSETESPISADEAYQIQAETISLRVARGEMIVGRKLGLTSKAKQQAMGIAEPIFGVLTDAMALKEGEPVALRGLIHPRVEPEVILLLGEDLAGPGVDEAAARAACAEIHYGFEVIDSRYADFRFTLSDVVADNTSAGRFVVSGKTLPDATDLRSLQVLLELDHEGVARATGAAVLGDPLRALALLANFVGTRGEVISGGSVVLTGGLTDAIPLNAGQVVGARFGDHRIEIASDD